MGEPAGPAGALGRDGLPLACVDCLGPATVQVLSPYGHPAGTFCGECWQAREALGRRINEMLAAAIEQLEGAMGTPDPAEILRQRLDEAEAAANEVHLARTCGCIDRDGDFSADPVYCSCDGPARVLADVAAKRRILALYKEACSVQSPDPATSGYVQGLEAAIRCLAGVGEAAPEAASGPVAGSPA